MFGRWRSAAPRCRIGSAADRRLDRSLGVAVEGLIDDIVARSVEAGDRSDPDGGQANDEQGEIADLNHQAQDDARIERRPDAMAERVHREQAEPPGRAHEDEEKAADGADKIHAGNAAPITRYRRRRRCDDSAPRGWSEYRSQWCRPRPPNRRHSGPGR
jgi:hypothetical protein